MPYTFQPGLAVITTYFNPFNNPFMRGNYSKFRAPIEQSGIKLITIECAFGDAEYQLTEYSNIIRVRSQSILWQKERLLNIALRYLPTDCRYVAWLDCDVILTRATWTTEVIAQIDSGKHYVQPFDRVVEIEAPNTPAPSRHSFAVKYGTYGPSLLDNDLQGYLADSGQTGLAWVAYRPTLEQEGFYDGCIVGGGDRAMAHAFAGIGSQKLDHIFGYNKPYKQHYEEWADRAWAASRRPIGHVEGLALHLYHGSMQSRMYVDRHEILSQYDPLKHIEKVGSGVFELTDGPDHEKLRSDILSYFDWRSVV